MIQGVGPRLDYFISPWFAWPVALAQNGNGPRHVWILEPDVRACRWGGAAEKRTPSREQVPGPVRYNS